MDTRIIKICPLVTTLIYTQKLYTKDIKDYKFIKFIKSVKYIFELTF